MPSCKHHQVSWSTHGDEEIDNPINKNNSPLINAWEDSLIEASTLTIFFSTSNHASSIVIANAMVYKC
jgi:hypothetical protein